MAPREQARRERRYARRKRWLDLAAVVIPAVLVSALASWLTVVLR